MPFNSLFLTCLDTGTSFSESGMKVRVEPEPGETVLFFVIDDQSNHDSTLRKTLSMDGSICDLVVFYTQGNRGKKVVCLVELKKGGRIKDAAEQITNTYHALLKSMQDFSGARGLQSCLRRVEWKAYVCLPGAAPKDIKQARDLLEQQFGRDNVDIKSNQPDLGIFLRRASASPKRRR